MPQQSESEIGIVVELFSTHYFLYRPKDRMAESTAFRDLIQQRHRQYLYTDSNPGVPVQICRFLCDTTPKTSYSILLVDRSAAIFFSRVLSLAYFDQQFYRKRWACRFVRILPGWPPHNVLLSSQRVDCARSDHDAPLLKKRKYIDVKIYEFPNHWNINSIFIISD